MVEKVQTMVKRKQVRAEIKAVRKLMKGIENVERMRTYPQPVEWWATTRRLWYEGTNPFWRRSGGVVFEAKRHGLKDI